MSLYVRYRVATAGVDDAVRQLVSEMIDRLSSRVATFESDVPLARSAGWPLDVQMAAENLSRVRKRKGSALYRATGLLDRLERPDLWRSFVRFAPYAFDASAFGVGGVVVAIDDESESVSMLLTPRELGELEIILPLEPMRS